MDLTGRKLGKYEVIERLGQGGMAAVYKAFQPGVDRHVAIKVMHPHLADSEDFVARFRREAQAVGRLQHANIVRVIDFDIEADVYYMVMDFIQGVTLQEYLKEHGPLPMDEALTLALHLADALSYAHEQGMIHRDIKPANVLFLDKAHTQPVLTDFGIARMAGEEFANLTVTGALVGTPAYMSPEAARGESCDERADIYSLGVVLYEMVTGRTPYQAETPFSLMMMQVNDPVPPPQEFNPNVPAEIEALLHQALDKDLAARFPTAAAFADALHDTLDTLHTAAPSAQNATRRRRTPLTTRADRAQSRAAAPAGAQSAPEKTGPNRRPLIFAAVGVVLIAVLFTAGILFLENQSSLTEGESTPGEVAEAEAAPPTADESAGDAEGIIETEENDSTENASVQAGITETLTNTASITASAAVSEPAAAPTDQASSTGPPAAGTLHWLTNEAGTATGYRLALNGVSAPPADSQYGLWLTDGDESTALPLGTLNVRNGRIIQEEATDIPQFLQFNRAIIGVQSASTTDGEAESVPDDPILTASLPDEFLEPLRGLLTGTESDSPGLLESLAAELELAVSHTGFVHDALNEGNMDSARQHAEHVINILDGETGNAFGDLDGDGQAQNPGNGTGVRVYAQQGGELVNAALAASVPSASVYGQPAADAFSAGADRIAAAVENALKIIASDTAAEAQPWADELQTQILALREGQDANDDGVNDPLANEGGLDVVVQLVPQMAQFAFVDASSESAGPLTALPVSGQLRLMPPVDAAEQAAPSVDYYGNSTSDSDVEEDAPLVAGVFLLTLDGVAAPPADAQYELLLASDASDDSSGEPLNLGPVDVELGHIWLEGESDTELLTGYGLALLTLVTDGEDENAATVAYTGTRSAAVTALINTLLEANGDDDALLTTTLAQLELTILHTGFLQDEIDSDNLAEARRHSEHVLNILAGEEGENFGDMDGDGQAQNPGDGVGLVVYLARIQAQLEELLTDESAGPQTLQTVQRMLVSIENALAFLDETETVALRVFAADTVQEVQAFEDEIRSLLEAVRDGSDVNGDGVIDPLVGEGGLLAIPALLAAAGEYTFPSP